MPQGRRFPPFDGQLDVDDDVFATEQRAEATRPSDKLDKRPDGKTRCVGCGKNHVTIEVALDPRETRRWSMQYRQVERRELQGNQEQAESQSQAWTPGMQLAISHRLGLDTAADYLLNWTKVTQAKIVDLGDTSEGRMRCHVTVLGLEEEKVYQFLVIQTDATKADAAGQRMLGCECATAQRPHMSSMQAPTISKRLLDGVELVWELNDPPDFPVLECQVQYRPEVVPGVAMPGMWTDYDVGIENVEDVMINTKKVPVLQQYVGTSHATKAANSSDESDDSASPKIVSKKEAKRTHINVRTKLYSKSTDGGIKRDPTVLADEGEDEVCGRKWRCTVIPVGSSILVHPSV